MSETTPTPNEDERNATSQEEEGTDDKQELEDLFNSEAPEGETLEEKVERMEQEQSRLKKGVAKFFSEKGKKEEKKTEKPTTVPSGTSPVLKALYLKQNPEAQEVWDEVEKEAAALKKDPFELYESSSYFKGEAKAKAEAKRVEEESKSKIAKPSSDTGSSSKVDLSKVKPEDVEKLKPSQKMDWIKAQAEKERNDVD